MTYWIDEKLLLAVLEIHCKQPLGKIGFMNTVDRVTRAVEAYLADPELKLMIVEEFSFSVSKQSIEAIQTVKRKRPDVTFIVIITTYEEDNLDLLSAAADYVLHYLALDFQERLGEIADHAFSN